MNSTVSTNRWTDRGELEPAAKPKLDGLNGPRGTFEKFVGKSDKLNAIRFTTSGLNGPAET
jgi:hypothetical protein